MNKKGFTLVEIIAAILIMLAILLIVVPNVRSILQRNALKMWKENEARLEEAAKKYLIIKKITIENNTTLDITKQQLIDEDLIKEVYDLSDKSKVCDAHIVVNNNNGNYEETAYIDCQNGYHTE